MLLISISSITFHSIDICSAKLIFLIFSAKSTAKYYLCDTI